MSAFWYQNEQHIPYSILNLSWFGHSRVDFLLNLFRKKKCQRMPVSHRRNQTWLNLARQRIFSNVCKDKAIAVQAWRGPEGCFETLCSVERFWGLFWDPVQPGEVLRVILRPCASWRGPEGCSEKVEFPRIVKQSASEGGKAVSPKHGTLLPPKRYPSTHFWYRLSRSHGQRAAGRINWMKNSNDAVGNRTRDLPVFSAVPQPTAPLYECSLT